MTRSIACVQIRNFHMGYRETPNSSANFKSRKSSYAPDNKISSNRISSHLESSVLGSAVKHLHSQYYGHLQGNHFKNKSTQTDYRENECQTLPWEPQYRVPEGQDPEVLTLAHFTWGNGLPAGVHEIDIINRMRKKRAWEEVLPPMDTTANIKARSALITALEADEWAFREAEIQFIMDLRMNLEEQLMQSKEDEKKKRAESRLKQLDERLGKRKQKELESIRNKFSRELRKLANKHKSVRSKHEKRNIVKFHATRELEFNNLKPRYECSQILQNNFGDEEIALNDSANVEVQPNWLLSTRKPRYSAAKSQMRICSRRHKRNEMKLLELCQNVESIKANIELTENCSLFKRKEKIPSLPPTPRRSPDSDGLLKDDVEQSCNLLQRIVEGRAAQCEILEGRNRYRELIEELQVARALEEHSKDLNETSRIKLLEQDEERKILQEQRLTEIMEALEGKTISVVLSFLTDELTRLQSEKKAHALSLLAERERVKREIAEASREQLELNQRQELDEIFRHILKVNQESVETYLEDIVREGIEWLSESEAKKYVVDLADKTDAMTKRLAANSDKIEAEGLVADMVCNLVLPEVDRELSRKRLHERQMSHLYAAHESIYHEILNIPDEDLLSEQPLQSDRSNSIEEKLTSCESAKINLSLYFCSKEDGVNSEIKIACEINCESRNVERPYGSIIELILKYSTVTNEEFKSDICMILEQMFSSTGKNYY
ncbi:hypothetical protein TSAR_016396 [Trichomalopsis sarcophagae]|uniref:Cilia- and flagella-associated protein 91 n=1 Tax=Trichomalopsis sarcophagae TaxID=543379 RepID=A0A232FKR2_9HYME|nr:hypothetical protein TSAR_016396 [Trichomalopsis sarcophagae]